MRKRCSKCKRNQRIKFFGKNFRYRLGVQSWCKDCMTAYSRTPTRRKKQKERWQQYMVDPKNQAYERKRGREKYRRDPEHAKDLMLRRLYGITLKKFKRTKKCLLCRRKVRRLVVDHNHKTEKYRGILCVQCNLVIGWIEKFPGMFRKIKVYLKRGLI